MLINIPKKTFDAYCHNSLELLHIGYAVRIFYVIENCRSILFPSLENNYAVPVASYWPENPKNGTITNLFFVSDEDAEILTKCRVYNVY